MDTLVDLIYFLNWPLTFILNGLSCCKITLLCCSFRFKLSAELAKLLVSMLSNGNKSIVAIEDNRQAVDITKVAVILEARKSLDWVVIARKWARKLDKRKVMFLHIYLQELNELHQRTVVAQLSRLDDLPIFVTFCQHASEAMTLEDEQAPVAGHSKHILRQKDRISRSVNIQSMWLIILPLSVYVFCMGQVDQCWPLHFILVPMGSMEGQIVVDEDS